MTFNFSDIQPEGRSKRIVDPIELFQSMRVTDPSINDLWLAQGDALRDWHRNRETSDASISLNTGAGKTLVGLLIAQSLVNETRGLVLYACSSIQLVLQTAKKAEGYGIPVTTYIGGEGFSNQLSNRGEAACITTYQSLFNGKSIFFRKDIAAVIFDDSHAAEHILRDHFSLHIRKDEFPDLYRFLWSEFRDYFHTTGKISSFEELGSDDASRLAFVHPSESRRSTESILKEILGTKVPTYRETTFAWEHLKDRLDLCAYIFSSGSVTITPPQVPVNVLPYFSTMGIRRVYLSATLTGEDVFIRTFGRAPSVNIAPSTTAGECERMILVPSLMTGEEDEITVTKEAIEPFKALILTPNRIRARIWSDIAVLNSGEEATAEIESFKGAEAPAKLLLTARYDGLDLPGDMCRIVVIDDLPSGAGPLERFLWEYLRLRSTLRTAVACRVVQSFGRISRGMSDHGVALLTGSRLIEWIQSPKNFVTLPRFLQKQLQMGVKLSERRKSSESGSLVASCLNRDSSWISAYERFIQDAEAEDTVAEGEISKQLALAETKALRHLVWVNLDRILAAVRVGGWIKTSFLEQRWAFSGLGRWLRVN